MKHLCSSKYIFLLLFAYSSLFANLHTKSAIVYYGNEISYPIVGIHDYIIVQPSNTNVHTHGFDVYKDKMYAYVSIGEIDTNTSDYKDVKKSWIVAENKAWKSKVLDLTNPEYKEFLFKKVIEPQIKRGFKNFFFDTLDSYQLIAKTDQHRAKNEAALVDIILTFRQRYPNSKLIINRGFEVIDKVHNAVNAVLFESYYYGIGGKKTSYEKVNNNEREWLDLQIKKVKKYNLDVICVDYLQAANFNKKSAQLALQLQTKGFIPYIANKDLDIYGKSSKEPIKREIFTLIDTSTMDRISLGAHQYGALPLEYKGYIQKLYDVSKPLPNMQKMRQYSGVVIWLTHNYKNPTKLLHWILQLKEAGIKIVFANSFGIDTMSLLEPLDITVQDFQEPLNNTNKVIYEDVILGYEMDPPLSQNGYYIKISKGKALYTVSDSNNHKSTLAAIMPWGGYAVSNAFMVTIGEDNIWTINPFEFFVKALRLKPLIVPDVTTQNGKRILFSHIDGDGIMNRVEFNPKLFSGDTIYSDILKKYNIPISVSIIGAEVNDNGLYPDLAPQLQKIVKKIYALPNVEPATHTFTHPFFWGKIKDNNLDEKYRLKPKGYKFSLDYEIRGMLEEINNNFLPKNKYPKAKTVFWSGDCAPTEKALAFTYKHNILNINGGDTYISNTHPWLSYVAPLGLQRGEYYQIYTGQQNENIYTNEWLGPFWGFKKVVQTFKLTDKPRRLKPINIYYHLYSGSKRASLNALKYVYNWALKQDVNPIFTSEYIPKVMDYYTVSMAQENGVFFFAGLRDLKTLRIEKKDAFIDFENSQNIIGINHFNNRSYLHVNQESNVFVKESDNNITTQNPYLISSNAKVIDADTSSKDLHVTLRSHVGLEAELYIPKNCTYTFTKGFNISNKYAGIIKLESKKYKEITIDATCTE